MYAEYNKHKNEYLVVFTSDEYDVLIELVGDRPERVSQEDAKRRVKIKRGLRMARKTLDK